MDRIDRFHRTVRALTMLFAALALLAGSAAVVSGTVWLKIDSESERQTVRFAGPLEWLATTGWDTDADRRIVIEGIRLDLQELWKEYRDLPAGEAREIAQGKTKHEEPYLVRVVSTAPPAAQAEGKLRLLVRDDEDEVTDLRFPLKVASFVTSLLGSFPLFGEVEADEQKTIRDFPPFRALDALGEYGPFVLFEISQEKPRARIAIE